MILILLMMAVFLLGADGGDGLLLTVTASAAAVGGYLGQLRAMKKLEGHIAEAIDDAIETRLGEFMLHTEARLEELEDRIFPKGGAST